MNIYSIILSEFHRSSGADSEIFQKGGGGEENSERKMFL